MKTTAIHARRALQLSAALLLGACALPGVQAQPSCLTPTGATTTVNLAIDPTTKLPVFTNSFPCTAPGPSYPDAPGNICFAYHTKTDLLFVLTGPGANQWQFKGLQLGGDGLNWPGQLPLGVYSDFEFDSDAGMLAGRPYVDIPPAGNSMRVHNNNCHEFIVHYRVLLERSVGLQKDGKRTAQPTFYRLHPIMDNRGHD